ncbi:MAG: hypothetical protein WBG86_10525 [Polyangiales bacterium]
MARTERTPLTIPRDLRHALVLYRIRNGTAATKPTVARESIDEVERGIGVSLPQPLLAVFAATGRDPYEILVLTEELRELYDLSPDLVAVTEQPPDNRRSRAPVYWCLDTTAPDGGNEMVWWSVSKPGRRHHLSILAFFRTRYLRGRATSAEATAVHGLSSKFRPAIVSQPRSAFRRVVHNQFGPGFVLREFNDGNHKVEVEFPSVGVKMLLASYVRDVPETGRKPSRTGTLRLVPRRTA